MARPQLKYDSSVRNGSRHLKIYIPDAVDATRIVDIRYTVTNACAGSTITTSSTGT